MSNVNETKFDDLHDIVHTTSCETNHVVVQGRLMHMRRVSRKCSFYDLESIENSNEGAQRLEVILKIIDDQLSLEQVEAIRHRIKLGDIVNIYGFIEPITKSINGTIESSLLFHAHDIITIHAWKDQQPGIPFRPAPSAHHAQQQSKHEEDVKSIRETIVPTSGSVVHCKFWVNTGACQFGEKCKSYHAPLAEIPEARASWLKERLHLKRERAKIKDDPLDPHGRINKHLRAQVFVKWLLEYIGDPTILSRGSGVIDIAGGRGNISFELWNQRQIPCTLIDPRPIKLSRAQHKRLREQHVDNSIAQAKIVPQKQVLFNSTTFLNDSAHVELIHNASLLIGMHPDEATDAIIDVALLYNKPFAIVPCCVFGHTFTERRLPPRNEGESPRKVTSYEDLIDYLKLKHKDIQQAFLPFDGKNLVLYYKPHDLNPN